MEFAKHCQPKYLGGLLRIDVICRYRRSIITVHVINQTHYQSDYLDLSQLAVTNLLQGGVPYIGEMCLLYNVPNSFSTLRVFVLVHNVSTRLSRFCVCDAI